MLLCSSKIGAYILSASCAGGPNRSVETAQFGDHTSWMARPYVRGSAYIPDAATDMVLCMSAIRVVMRLPMGSMHRHVNVSLVGWQLMVIHLLYRQRYMINCHRSPHEHNSAVKDIRASQRNGFCRWCVLFIQTVG